MPGDVLAGDRQVPCLAGCVGKGECRRAGAVRRGLCRNGEGRRRQQQRDAYCECRACEPSQSWSEHDPEYVARISADAMTNMSAITDCIPGSEPVPRRTRAANPWSQTSSKRPGKRSGGAAVDGPSRG